MYSRTGCTSWSSYFLQYYFRLPIHLHDGGEFYRMSDIFHRKIPQNLPKYPKTYVFAFQNLHISKICYIFALDLGNIFSTPFPLPSTPNKRQKQGGSNVETMCPRPYLKLQFINNTYTIHYNACLDI